MDVKPSYGEVLRRSGACITYAVAGRAYYEFAPGLHGISDDLA